MKVLIGSRAIKALAPEFREPQDWDYFTDSSEGELPEDVFSHERLSQWNWGESATLDELYTIKLSHIFWEVPGDTWRKHFQDIIWLQEHTDAKLIPELYSLLYGIWEEVHGRKKANLEQEPEDFFNEHVERVYEHDSLHASVAYGEEPLFKRILRDDHAVAVSKAKFDALSHEEKLQLCREEFYATALERFLIPQDYRGNPARAYQETLMMTVTRFSKGWFPLFIAEHFFELRTPDINYLKRHRANSSRLIAL